MKTNSRIIAMQWWNNLSSNERTRQCDVHRELLIGNSRQWESLTGREIELIYNAVLRMDDTVQDNPDPLLKELYPELYPGNEAGAFDELDLKADNEREDKEIASLEEDLWKSPTGMPSVPDDLLNGTTWGDWIIDGNLIIGKVNPEYDGQQGVVVCDFNPKTEYLVAFPNEQKANARLIAAAPVLAKENKELKEELRKAKNALATALESIHQSKEYPFTREKWMKANE
jgi:hypothetical protein